MTPAATVAVITVCFVAACGGWWRWRRTTRGTAMPGLERAAMNLSGSVLAGLGVVYAYAGALLVWQAVQG